MGESTQKNETDAKTTHEDEGLLSAINKTVTSDKSSDQDEAIDIKKLGKSHGEESKLDSATKNETDNHADEKASTKKPEGEKLKEEDIEKKKKKAEMDVLREQANK